MFKKGDYVIYPKYGCSKIKRITKEKVGDKEVNYYELSFQDNLFVSVPATKAEELGMRYPLTKKELKKELENLDRRLKPNLKDTIKLSDISKEKLSTGSFHDAVSLVRILNTVRRDKRKNKKDLELGEKDNLQSAMDFIRSEVEVVLGEKAIKKYKL